MFFSVIIPCFNSSQYIERCVNSVLSQNCNDFEIIIIDDGSTDSTLDVLKKYDDISSIRVITQENQGVSVARNLGISLAQGDYIIFIDSDDWVKPGYFEFCKSNLLDDDIDILIMNHTVMSPSLDYDTKHRLINGEHGIDDIFYASFYGRISNSPCDKIFSRKMVVNQKCSFPSGVTVGEDALFFIRVLSCSNKVISSDKSYYVYMQDTGGVTKVNINRKKIDDIVYVVKQIRRLSSSSEINDINMMEFKQLIYYYFNYFGSGRNDLNNLFKTSLDGLKMKNFMSCKWKLYY
ncbi:glycosyltransferase family 2 protein, partial [Vibrio fluvialis]